MLHASKVQQRAKYVLRSYQEENSKLIQESRRVIIADDPGLGKTLSTLDGISKVTNGSILVICPKIATGVWADEAMKWLGWDSIVVMGTAKKRRDARREFIESNPRILITNFAVAEEIQSIAHRWDSIIVDETHLGGLLSERCGAQDKAKRAKFFETMKKFESRNLVLLTGTPIRRGPQDLWPMLYLCQPKQFPSKWSFINKWCYTIRGRYGVEVLGRPKNPKEWKAMLKPLVIRHRKKDVAEQLPEKIRQFFPLELSTKQAKFEKELREDLMSETDEDLVVVANHLGRDLRYRQMLVCPKILGIDENGPALDAVVDYFIPQAFDAQRSLAIATPFKSAVPYVREAILAKHPGTHIEVITGGSKEPAHDIAKRFQAHPSYKKIILYTIKSGASWTATAASTGIMLGREWSPGDNYQAEDRIHRIGQAETVFWYYTHFKGTVDEQSLSTLLTKLDAQEWSMDPEASMQHLRDVQKRNLESDLD